MGQFQVSVVAIGNHGCERGRGNGETVIGCERPNCTDCITREYVRRLKRTGADVQVATITHWPGQPGEVVDDLRTGIRTGQFPEYATRPGAGRLDRRSGNGVF